MKPGRHLIRLRLEVDLTHALSPPPTTEHARKLALRVTRKQLSRLAERVDEVRRDLKPLDVVDARLEEVQLLERERKLLVPLFLGRNPVRVPTLAVLLCERWSAASRVRTRLRALARVVVRVFLVDARVEAPSFDD